MSVGWFGTREVDQIIRQKNWINRMVVPRKGHFSPMIFLQHNNDVSCSFSRRKKPLSLAVLRVSRSSCVSDDGRSKKQVIRPPQAAKRTKKGEQTHSNKDIIWRRINRLVSVHLITLFSVYSRFLCLTHSFRLMVSPIIYPMIENSNFSFSKQKL